MAWEAETVAKQHPMKDLYDITKMLLGKQFKFPHVALNAIGNRATRKEDQLNRFEE